MCDGGVFMRLRSEKGFTLIEVIVVAGIIAILAGILVPLIFKEIDESRIMRANADIGSVSSAILVFKKDTGQWPVMDPTCNANGTLLVGSGVVPANLPALGYDTSITGSFADHLTTDTNGCYNNWKGAYMAGVKADPWGFQYVMNVNGFAIDGRPVWIISAGPNGQMETPSFSATVLGDDIGMRIK